MNSRGDVFWDGRQGCFDGVARVFDVVVIEMGVLSYSSSSHQKYEVHDEVIEISSESNHVAR